MAPRRHYYLAVILSLLVALCAGGILCGASSNALRLFHFGGSPDLFSVDPSPIVKFAAREGETVAVEFTLKNITSRRVRVLGAKTSCDCTTLAQTFPMDFPPRSSQKIRVKVKVPALAAGQLIEEMEPLVDGPGKVPTLVVDAEIMGYR
jgi:hypothetical protein